MLCTVQILYSYILLTAAGYDNASKTKQYDAEAIQYTSYLVYPLVACYAVYALIYKTHKSWYSWLLSSLVGAVYSFGFIMMVPQASKAVLTGCSTVQPADVFTEVRLPRRHYLKRQTGGAHSQACCCDRLPPTAMQLEGKLLLIQAPPPSGVACH